MVASLGTITHLAGETGKWIFGIGLVLVAVALAAIVVLFVGSFVWFFGAALWSERVWFALIGAGIVVALAWAAIKSD
jgi:hypothetical protein